jgi:hypothetical protein
MTVSKTANAVGQVLTVDPSTRRVEVGIRDGSTLQVAVIESGPFFRWPLEGETWRICRRGYTWYLDSLIEDRNTENDTISIEDLDAGHSKIYSEVIRTPSGKELATSTPWTDWIPDLLGWSVDPTNAVYRYTQIGGQVTLCIRQGASGTSNDTTKSISLPIPAATIPNASWQATAWAIDASTELTIPSRALIESDATVVTFDKDGSGAGGWTASGGHRIRSCTIIYEAASP